MRPDNDVDFAFFEFLQDFGLLFGRLESVEVFDGDGEAVEAFCEGVVVLQSQHGGGHQNGHLLRVAAGLEGGAHGHFGLAEAHVAAHEAVHRVLAFHVALHVVGGFQLVGGVLVDERSLQLVLQVVVGRKLESGRAFALGVEFNQFARNVLNLALGLVFQAVPCTAAEGAEVGFGTVLAAVFSDAVQRVDAHIKQVAFVVNQADSLLRLAVVLDGFEAVEAPDAVVDVGHIVAGLQFVEVFQRDGLLGREVVAQVETVVTLKDLVVGVAAHLQILVYEAAVDGDGLGFEVAVKLVVVVDVVQNCLNA